MKVHHTAVITRDIAVATRFYRTGLRREITPDPCPHGNCTIAHSIRYNTGIL